MPASKCSCQHSLKQSPLCFVCSTMRSFFGSSQEMQREAQRPCLWPQEMQEAERRVANPNPKCFGCRQRGSVCGIASRDTSWADAIRLCMPYGTSLFPRSHRFFPKPRPLPGPSTGSYLRSTGVPCRGLGDVDPSGRINRVQLQKRFPFVPVEIGQPFVSTQSVVYAYSFPINIQPNDRVPEKYQYLNVPKTGKERFRGNSLRGFGPPFEFPSSALQGSKRVVRIQVASGENTNRLNRSAMEKLKLGEDRIIWHPLLDLSKGSYLRMFCRRDDFFAFFPVRVLEIDALYVTKCMVVVQVWIHEHWSDAWVTKSKQVWSASRGSRGRGLRVAGCEP